MSDDMTTEVAELQDDLLLFPALYPLSSPFKNIAVISMKNLSNGPH
jgi:hypothetical protein